MSWGSAGPAIRPGAVPRHAELLDIAPTVLHLLGIPVPGDMDGRVLTEILEPAPTRLDLAVGASALAGAGAHVAPAPSFDSPYTAEEDAAIQQRLADLGYL